MAICASTIVYASVKATHCSPKRPVQFGKLTSRSMSADAISSSDREDCPICKKYSQGPCGKIFQEWLQCTDNHPGKSKDNPDQDDHIEKCFHLAEPLSKCLKENQAFYDNLDTLDIEGEEEVPQGELQEAWMEVIQQLEEKFDKPLKFDDRHCPQLEIRQTDYTGMAAFSLKLKKGVPLVMCYIKDQDGRLLAAGSTNDLWDMDEGWGVLRLKLDPKQTISITAFALYTYDDGDELYSHTQLLPPKSETNT